MGKASTALDDAQIAFLTAQKVFFVATAPAGPVGHVNCSPKGLDSLRVLSPTCVAWLDFVGSGVETIAHLRQNGRLCLMLCAFEGSPKILRLHGTGRVVEPADEGFAALRAHFEPLPDAALRAILVLDVQRVADACGFGVPLMDYVGERSQMGAWGEQKGAAGVAQYQRDKNARSLDGLPGLRWVEGG